MKSSTHRVAALRKRRLEKGEAELRGLYAPVALHARLKDEIKKLIMELKYETKESLQRQIEELRADAKRYRWLKSRQGLTLRSEKQPNVWKRIDGTEFSATHYLAEGGTQHAPAESLDELIDAAMLLSDLHSR